MENEKRLINIEHQLEGVSRSLEGNERTGQPGVIQQLRDLDERVIKIETNQKTQLVILKSLFIGFVLAAIVFGFLTIKEAIGIVK